MRHWTFPLRIWSLCLCVSTAHAQMEEIAPIEEDVSLEGAGDASVAGDDERSDAPVLLEEFAIDERNVVISAARTRTTIQQAPGIITVVTAAEIAARGHRTVNDILRTIPGFEGGRLDSNGWFEEGFARGQPRTLLILINGVNVTEPVRNGTTIDRKIPVDAIKRIEVTSGPGGVLWGSNALLGVVNIILKDADDLDGVQVWAGGGDGPGAQSAIKGAAAYGGRFADDAVRVYTSVNFYTDRGAELTPDAVKVLGVLPAPAPDGPTLFEDRTGITDFNKRDWWLSTSLDLRLFDVVTIDWLLQWERDYRQIATGGAFLEGNRLPPDAADDAEPDVVHEHTEGNDAIKMLGITWRDRFWQDQLGLSLKLYGVDWIVDETPFWAFPPRSEIPPLENGVVIDLEINPQRRFGLNFDADLALPLENTLLFGMEAFQDRVDGSRRRDALRSAVIIAELADPDADDFNGRLGIFTPDRCPPPGTYVFTRGTGYGRATFDSACRASEPLVNDMVRSVAAIYVSNEWKASRRLALQPGFRLQFSNTYDTVGLFSGALVWNVVDKIFLKLNYAEGFRPPEIQSTHVPANTVSTVSFEANPDLDVERSRAGELELNALVLEDVGFVEKVYLRGDLAYTVVSDLVRNQGGQFVNSGERAIHSIEALARADLSGGHEIWAGGHFVRAEDSVSGPVRNFPNRVFSGGFTAVLLPDALELTTLFTWLGAQEDFSRAADANSELSGFRVSNASDAEVVEVASYLLLRFGLRAPKLLDDHLELSAFVYNALDETVFDPDFFFDDRVQTRPQPRPGWSGFAQAKVTF